MGPIECISSKGHTLCYVVAGKHSPDKTTFLTPPEQTFQAGFVVYPEGGRIERHFHHATQRRIRGTPEVLLVKKGLCEVDIYNREKELVATRRIEEGDLLILVDCGHAFRMLEDTVLLEIKQGPYMGLEEKVHF